jgi:two-component system OmpR family response regulator
MNRVLIVEDDSWTRYALARIFGHEGWEVRTASTVAEGIDLVDSGPDCIVLDLSLPDGNGSAILRKIREEGRSIRVVLCTRFADTHLAEIVRSLSPDAVISKPVEVEELLKACGP